MFNIGMFDGGMFDGGMTSPIGGVNESNEFNESNANVSTGDLSNCSLFETSNHCIQQISEQN